MVLEPRFISLENIEASCHVRGVFFRWKCVGAVNIDSHNFETLKFDEYLRKNVFV